MNERPARRLIILTEGHTEPVTAKTAGNIIRYRPEEVVALLDKSQQGQTSQSLLGVGGEIPVVGSLADAPGANTLLIGIAPPGGKIPPPWRLVVLEAIERGMDVMSGLHDFMADDAEFAAAAELHGTWLIDVRKNDERDVATRQGIDPRCLRIQTIGHDCSIGKMITALEVHIQLKTAGYDSKFVATGQTGILVEGDGCPIDCVVGDFINGAAEKLVLKNQHHQILLIEGQGSLAHPRYSPVTLGLLHGCLPHGLILCYEVNRHAVRRMEHVPIPPLAKIREIYETMAGVMHPSKVIGVAMHSGNVSGEEAEAERERVRGELGLPVCDVFRHGPNELVEAVICMRSELDGETAIS